MESQYEKIKKNWGERSRKYGEDIAGVPPKSFPVVVNNYTDNWEFSLIQKFVKNKTNFTVMDIGCGIIGKIRDSKNSEIVAVGFDPGGISDLVESVGGKVKNRFGIPFFTLSLPVFFLLDKLKNKNILISYLKFVGNVEKITQKILYPSIYIVYVISKD